LRKIIKNSNTEQVNTFRLHYFPNIPVTDACNGGTAGNSEAAAPAGNSRIIQGMPSVPSNHERQLHQAEIERQAHEQGFAKGEQEGQMAAQRQCAPLTAALETTLVELDGIREKIRQHMEQEVVELALHVARKVVRHELTVSKDAIVCVVKEAMNKLDDPGKICIRLNPEDLKRIYGAGDRLKSVMENLDSIHFEEDAGINCGGCYIQTEYGEIDARIEEQLRAIEEAFRAEMRNPTEQT
jgi:flagellar biosynthesis/type III secretory pathway protein FliH